MANTATDRILEASSRLGVLIDAHASDAGRRLGKWLRPWLRDGETLPDFSLALRLPARMLRETGRLLVARQKALDETKDAETETRLRRDHAASALLRKLVASRRLLTAFFGPQRASTLLGIAGATAQRHQHDLLLTQADAFVKLFRLPETLAVPSTNGLVFDPAALADELEPLATAFREALDQYRDARRARAARRVAKDDAWADLERALRCVVFVFKGSLLLIRRPDLAKKVGPVPRF